MISSDRLKFNSREGIRTKKSVFYSVKAHKEEMEEIREKMEEGTLSWKDEKKLKEKLFEEAKKFEIEYEIHQQAIGRTAFTVLKMKEHEDFAIHE